MKVRFIFDFLSPYSYLSWQKFPHTIGRLSGNTYQYVPVLFPEIIKHWGQKRPSEIPPKRAYTFAHCLRIANNNNVPFTLPKYHPFDPTTSLCLSLYEVSGVKQKEVINALWCAGWQHGKDLQDPGQLADVLIDNNLCPTLLEKAQQTEMQALLKNNTQAVIKHGVFGVPSFLTEDNTLFWGYDSIPHLEQHLLGKDSIDKNHLNSFLQKGKDYYMHSSHSIRPTVSANLTSQIESKDRDVYNLNSPKLENLTLFAKENKSGITVEIKNKIGFIKFNNPKKLNAFTDETIKLIVKCINMWNKTKAVKLIIFDKEHFPLANTSFFCVGGDLTFFQKMLLEKDEERAYAFFKSVSDLMLLIKDSAIPIIAINDGLTFGGGLGISVNSKYRIATENTRVSMPENNIGFFPNVGSSYFLTQLQADNPSLGLYLGLTGHKLNARDCMNLGLHTHFIKSQYLSNLIDSLLTINLESNNIDKTIINILSKYHGDSFQTMPSELNYALINQCFGTNHNSVKDIFLNLQNKSQEAWCQQTLNILQSLSPISLELTYLYFNEIIKNPDLNYALNLDYEISKAMFNKAGGVLADNLAFGIARLLEKSKTTNWPKIENKLLKQLFENIKTNQCNTKMRSKL